MICAERGLLNPVKLAGKQGVVSPVGYRELHLLILMVFRVLWKGIKLFTSHFFLSHASL